VLKKKKIVQAKNATPSETGGSFTVKPGKGSRPRRAAATRKSRETKASKTAGIGNTSMPREADGTASPSDEAIRLRAYFISERRRRFALPGDAESDWLEARRQLLSEADGG